MGIWRALHWPANMQALQRHDEEYASESSEMIMEQQSRTAPWRKSVVMVLGSALLVAAMVVFKASSRGLFGITNNDLINFEEKTCSQPHENCMESRCCADDGAKCFLKTVLTTPTAAMEAAERRWFVSGRLLDGQIAIPRAPEPVKIPTTRVGEHGHVNTMSWYVNQHWQKTRQVPSNWNAARISFAMVKHAQKMSALSMQNSQKMKAV